MPSSTASLTEGLILPEGLGVRWPSAAIRAAYAQAHDEFEEQFFVARRGGADADASRLHAFSVVCRACRQTGREQRNAATIHWSVPFRSAPLGERVQSIASVLAMLTHAEPRPVRIPRMTNLRRTHADYGTYPNSPALSRDLARRVIERLLADSRISEALRACRDGNGAGGVPFRLLELSFESGQLLAAVTLEVLRQLGIPTDRRTPEAHNIVHVLAGRCLYGYDRNPLASLAAQCVFDLITLEITGRRISLRQLRTGDTLQHIADSEMDHFDAVINNPPWGEKLADQERAWIRRHFHTTRKQPDTYVAFVELGIRRLRRGGVFGFIIPSQFLAAENAAGLRAFMGNQTRLEHLILLPRTEFSDATVRALVLVGQRLLANDTDRCLVTSYSFRYHLCYRGRANARAIPHQQLAACGTKAWWPVVARGTRQVQLARSRQLRDVARLMSGIKLSDLEPVAPTVEQPSAFNAIRGRDFGRMMPILSATGISVSGTSSRRARHQPFRNAPRVFVRELVRRDGRMCATVATNGVLPLHGVLTLVCEGIRPTVAAALLNSSLIAAINRCSLGGMSKVDFQRITLAELGELPVARELCTGSAIAARIDSLACQALRSPGTLAHTSIMRAIDRLIWQLYQKGRS